MMTWWFLTFMAPAIKAKVHQLPGVEHLYTAITKDQLEIPAYITEYDMAVKNLSNYYYIYFLLYIKFFFRQMGFTTSNRFNKSHQILKRSLIIQYSDNLNCL